MRTLQEIIDGNDSYITDQECIMVISEYIYERTGKRVNPTFGGIISKTIREDDLGTYMAFYAIGWYRQRNETSTDN